MDSFQKTTLVVAIVILIVCLVIEGIILSNGKQQWPPSTANCPDYWLDVCGNGTLCQNPANIAQQLSFGPTVSKCQMYTNTAYGTGAFGYIPWDGINYGVSNPCSTTS